MLGFRHILRAVIGIFRFINKKLLFILSIFSLIGNYRPFIVDFNS
jgi:hypothetical protein